MGLICVALGGLVAILNPIAFKTVHRASQSTIEEARDAMVIQALTSPVHLVSLPKQPGTVRFVRARA